MSYVDGYYDKTKDAVFIAERVNGKRSLIEYKPEYNFYIDDPKGRFTSIHGDRVSEIRCRSSKEFTRTVSLQGHHKKYESDIKPLNKILSRNYKDTEQPKLHTAFFDIEVDFSKDRGYANPDDPFMPITAIGVYQQWNKQMICLSVPPSTLTWEQALSMTAHMPDVILCKTEAEMLNLFLLSIEDADVISGWNSEGYDIPYTVNRIIKVLGKVETRRLSLWDQLPKARTYVHFNSERSTYDLTGRIHLDYMQLYKKYNYEERHTYRLDYIGEMEVKEKKVAYSGTLDELYNKDFVKFLEYNIQDVMLLHKMDMKLQFIDLANTIAHTNTVLIPSTMGAVATTEQAIINEAHNRGMVVPDRVRTRNEETQAAGAYVAHPVKGLHKWVGSMDINSLYPSIFRALNMANETLVGQIRTTYTDQEISSKMLGTYVDPVTGKALKAMKFADAWAGKFATNEFEWVMNRNNQVSLFLDFEDGSSIQTTGAEIYNMVFHGGQPWNISANGTIFRTDIQGVIPGLLERWYNERKVQQKNKVNFQNLKKGIQVPEAMSALTSLPKGKSITIPLSAFSEIELLFQKSSIQELSNFVQENGMFIEDGLIKGASSAAVDEAIRYWDKRQLVSKISLNSLYGAYLNAGCRFFDKRIGQSTTLTGRRIARYMAAKTNEMLTGKFDYLGETIISGDTDSVYFSAAPVLPAGETLTLDSAVALYDHISNTVSSTFPEFLRTEFNVPLSSGKVMKAGREVVGRAGLFIAKKRYAIMCLDIEGMRPEGGKLKAMGLDIKRADTPGYVQDFLEEILVDTLNGADKNDVIDKIVSFKKEFKTRAAWEKGMPKAVNNLTKYRQIVEANEMPASVGRRPNHGYTDKELKSTIPGHVRASINYNKLRKAFNDKYSIPIVDGQKIIFCRLKKNQYGFDNIAYPVDEPHLQKWFTSLPFDEEAMEEAVLDKKIQNVVGEMKWDLSVTNHSAAQNQFFDFG